MHAANVAGVGWRGIFVNPRSSMVTKQSPSFAHPPKSVVALPAPVSCLPCLPPAAIQQWAETGNRATGGCKLTVVAPERPAERGGGEAGWRRQRGGGGGGGGEGQLYPLTPHLHPAGFFPTAPWPTGQPFPFAPTQGLPT